MMQQGKPGPRSPGGNWTLGSQHLLKLSIKGRHHFIRLLSIAHVQQFADGLQDGHLLLAFCQVSMTAIGPCHAAAWAMHHRACPCPHLKRPLSFYFYHPGLQQKQKKGNHVTSVACLY